MAKRATVNHNYNYNTRRSTPGYGLGKFLIDAILTLITGGLWLIVIFVREMRRR